MFFRISDMPTTIRAIDPRADYLEQRLKGCRRVRGQWKEIPVENGKLLCETLGLELHVDGNRLRFFDAATQQYLASPEERAEIAEERIGVAEERAHQAETARRRVEEENERLRRKLEALRRARKNGAG